MKVGTLHATCEDCWRARNPHKTPYQGIDREIGTCCYCGEPTTDGIFIRVDPQLVPYPSAQR